MQRVRAALMKASVAGAILTGFMLTSHPPVFLGLLFLAGLYIVSGMLRGRHPAMVYPYAFPVACRGCPVDAGSGLCHLPADYVDASSAFSSAFGVALLGALTDWQAPDPNPETARKNPPG
jgi:hypothetical protein